MEQEYSVENAKKYIKQRFMEQGDFLILKEEVFDRMLDRMKQIGSIEIPQEAFLSVLSVDEKNE